MREKIGLHCDVISGYAFKTSDWKTEGVPVIKIGNISNGSDVIIDEATQYVDEDFLLSLNERFVVSRGDILISLTGSHINQPTSMVGRTCRNLSNNMYLLNQRAGKVIPFANTEKQYLYYLLSTKAIKYDIANRAYGGANQVNVSPTDIKNIKWDFPSKVIQSTIANILSKYDELIEVNNQRIKLLEKAVEELYKEWFVRFRFPNWQNTEFENGIPKGWKKRQLKDFINFERGVSYTSNDLEDGGYILLSMNNIRPYGGFIKDYSRKYCGKFNLSQIVQKNDLIMSITDMTQDRRIIGYTGLVGEGEDNRVISMHLLKLSSPLYDNIYLNCLFNYSGLSRIIAERATGTNVLGMTVSILNNVRCICPNMNLVNEFTGKIQPIVNKIHSLESINDNLIKQRDLLLPRLMSGKLEV